MSRTHRRPRQIRVTDPRRLDDPRLAACGRDRTPERRANRESTVAPYMPNPANANGTTERGRSKGTSALIEAEKSVRPRSWRSQVPRASIVRWGVSSHPSAVPAAGAVSAAVALAPTNPVSVVPGCHSAPREVCARCFHRHAQERDSRKPSERLPSLSRRRTSSCDTSIHGTLACRLDVQAECLGLHS